MQFAWDPEKARSNRVKHRVSFDLAQKVFEDPCTSSFSTGSATAKSVGMRSVG